MVSASKQNKPIWRHRTVDITNGACDPGKLEQLESWVRRQMHVHDKCLFIKLEINMPILQGHEHAGLVATFQNLLFVELCREIAQREDDNIPRNLSLVSLFWSRMTEESVDVYIGLNGSIWSSLLERNNRSGKSLVEMIEKTWTYSLSRTFGCVTPGRQWIKHGQEWLLENDHNLESLEYNDLMLAMSSMAKYRRYQNYALAFANSSAITGTIKVVW